MNTTTYSYQILNLITTDSILERPKNVKTVLVTITADKPSGGTAEISFPFELEPGETFIPFEDLTEQEVRTWIDAHSRWSLIPTEIDAFLNMQAEAVVEVRPVPWITEPSTEEIQVFVHNSSTSTTVYTTSSVVSGSISSAVNEEYLKALIYQVLEEIQDTNV